MKKTINIFLAIITIFAVFTGCSMQSFNNYNTLDLEDNKVESLNEEITSLDSSFNWQTQNKVTPAKY